MMSEDNEVEIDPEARELLEKNMRKGPEEGYDQETVDVRDYGYFRVYETVWNIEIELEDQQRDMENSVKFGKSRCDKILETFRLLAEGNTFLTAKNENYDSTHSRKKAEKLKEFLDKNYQLPGYLRDEALSLAENEIEILKDQP